MLLESRKRKMHAFPHCRTQGALLLARTCASKHSMRSLHFEPKELSQSNRYAFRTHASLCHRNFSPFRKTPATRSTRRVMSERHTIGQSQPSSQTGLPFSLPFFFFFFSPCFRTPACSLCLRNRIPRTYADRSCANFSPILCLCFARSFSSSFSLFALHSPSLLLLRVPLAFACSVSALTS